MDESFYRIYHRPELLSKHTSGSIFFACLFQGRGEVTEIRYCAEVGNGNEVFPKKISGTLYE